jgi:hypothetical protein
MKRAIMWITCHALFEIGNLISKIDVFDSFTMYPAYNWLLIKSFNINERYGFKVWL